MKRILAIETSCDETAISVVDFDKNGTETKVTILAHEISSQIDMHREWGGVVPNIAKREHAKALVPMLLDVLRKANLSSKEACSLDEKYLEKLLEREPELFKTFINKIGSINKPQIDAIVVTSGPGLEPALWVGINFARALSHVWNLPLVPANHMEGHILSGLLTSSNSESFIIQEPNFPALALLISGGHAEIVKAENLSSYELIGKTRDDAIGEAFDKVARILGLPYPGGPEISKLADLRDQEKFPNINLPRPMIGSDDFDFSFSGLKTAVLYKVKEIDELTEDAKIEIAYQFETAVTDVIIKKVTKAINEFDAKSLIVGGGVIANKRIRHALSVIDGTELFLPEQKFTTDNATMIALAGFFKFDNGDFLSPNTPEFDQLKANGNMAVHG